MLESALRTLRWEPRPGLALTVGVPVALLRLGFDGLEAGAMPWGLTWIGVLLAAWIGGLWPALVVSLVGLLVGEHVLSTAGKDLPGAGGLAIYGFLTLVLALPADLYLRMARRRQADQRLLNDLSARMQRIARLNAVGEMAGALAHELNQPLTAIANYADAVGLVLRGAPADIDRAVELLQKIVRQTERAAGIIARVRGQLAGGDLDLRPQSLKALFEEATEIGLARARDAFALRFEIDPRADAVLADRIQLEQVMINLVRNAAEAMAAGGTRELRIGAALRGEGLVECFVADRGPGISAEVQARLFEPFATDKSEGTGLGLAVSRTIVEGHGGRIWAEPNPAGGAVFRFTLRAVDGRAAG